jgi:hypothetical protein
MGLMVACTIGVLGLGMISTADAGEEGARQRASGTKVRGYTERRGGYSYSYSDTINTYGDARSRYGATELFRDPMLDRQTNAGPFDHGFFFESGVSPRGGNSPYMN